LNAFATSVETLVAKAFKEDTAKAKGSSIAFLAEYDGKRMLFTGDAHPSVLADSLDRLPGGGGPMLLDVFKLSHHGSAHNTSPDLVRRLRCAHALISTNGVKFRHPEAACIARLVSAQRDQGLTLHFNYATDFNARWNDVATKRKFGYEAEYGRYGALTLRV
jgi:beta-lactamase superfamily II metal-dependent hydrolase